MSHEDVDLSVLVRERIAAHVPGSTIDDEGSVRLGETGISVRSSVASLEPLGSSYSAALYFSLSGGPFGPDPSFASISGYHATPVGAVVEGACLWVCSVLDVLASAGLVNVPGYPADPETVSAHEVHVHGRAFRLVSTGIDRCLNVSEGADFHKVLRDARAPFGDSGMSGAVVASDRLPLLVGPHATLLSCFSSWSTAGVTTEVKVHGADWPMAGPAIELSGDLDGAVVLLRDIAVLVPQAPGRLDLPALSATLAELGRVRTAVEQVAGWGGWRAHAGRLDPPISHAQIAAVVDPAQLPADYVRYLTEVSGGGAGPGYGLVAPTISDGELLLAHAGCGVRWVLRRDGVWIDALAADGTFRRTDDSFTDWYARWLDNACSGSGPMVDWDAYACANVAVLSQVVEAQGHVAPDSLRVTLTPPPGRPAVPCHSCVEVYDRFGQRESSAFSGA